MSLPLKLEQVAGNGLLSQQHLPMQEQATAPLSPRSDAGLLSQPHLPKHEQATAPSSARSNRGLLSRRHLLGLGLAGLGGAAGQAVLAATGATGAGAAGGAGSNQDAANTGNTGNTGSEPQLPLQIPEWSKTPAPGSSAYGTRSPFTADIQRLANEPNPLYPGGGASRSPLHRLQGTITPNALHFERHHAGVPTINPAAHRLVINGLVRQPLVFRYEDLLRYPMRSRVHFIECSGNSAALLRDPPPDSTVQAMHGLVSGAEWSGVPLAVLLDEAGVDPAARWVNAVGADAASMGRSVPLAKALDDVLVALYQNGEPVRPEQGYPMRLLVPGWEGNISVKWLTQLKLSATPGQFRDETSKYSDTLPDRSTLQFTFPMGCKSVITSPSGQMQLRQQGVYPITGLAWSGHGRIARVEVTADGGRSWAEARLEPQLNDRALTRFQLPWHWRGGEAVLQSRATDSAGNVQPTRAAILAERGSTSFYHFNGIQSWRVATGGEVTNVYA